MPVSYSFRVTKDEDGIRVICPDSMLPHVPEGVFTINGHHVPAGQHGGYSLGMSFSDGNRTASTQMGDAH